jgi:hypothetical protein
MAMDPYYYARDYMDAINQGRVTGNAAIGPKALESVLMSNAKASQQNLALQSQLSDQRKRTQLMEEEERRRQKQQEFQNWMGVGTALGNTALFGPMAYQGWKAVLGGGGNQAIPVSFPATTGMTVDPALEAMASGSGANLGIAGGGEAIPITSQAAITSAEAPASAGLGAAALPAAVGLGTYLAGYYGSRAVGNSVGQSKFIANPALWQWENAIKNIYNNWNNPNEWYGNTKDVISGIPEQLHENLVERPTNFAKRFF